MDAGGIRRNITQSFKPKLPTARAREHAIRDALETLIYILLSDAAAAYIYIHKSTTLSLSLSQHILLLLYETIFREYA